MFYKTESEVTKRWKDDKVLLSIICVAYNHEKYIEQALDSFLIQETDFAFEIVINDDCSTDNTARIIKAYQDKYPKIIKPIYQKENCFQKNINFMKEIFIPVIQGAYIALCDGDDYWTDRHKLQKQVDFLEANPEFMGCSHNTITVEKNNETSKLVAYNGHQTDVHHFDEYSKGECYFHTSSYVYRFGGKYRTEVEEYLQFYNSDWYMCLVFSYFGPIKSFNNIMSAYRIHDLGIWSANESCLNEIYNILACVSIVNIFDEKYRRNFYQAFLNVIRAKNSSEVSELLLKSATEEEIKNTLIMIIDILNKDDSPINVLIGDFRKAIDYQEKMLHKNNDALKLQGECINECNKYIKELEEALERERKKGIIEFVLKRVYRFCTRFYRRRN
ncbi:MULTISPECIES: glycosyltransferase family 2 protein [Francisella]|uniref:glycosyltransferase family 2 protein n=1 Tax=Francisella TaxID=262 RepID=UPI0015D03392|nr:MULTISPECIES: glycosyltransferase family 2 protein [Francisella]